jgi:catechol 2,3-dioxygenase-like lactoylglutathione lyase family enzyme
MSTDVIGIDHIYLTVSDLPASELYYDQLMPLLGFKKAINSIGGEPHIHFFCRHFGVSLRPARARQDHDPYAPGLHHFCFRVDTVEDLHELYREMKALDLQVSEPKAYVEYAPDYHAIFFTDPDGIRLEVTNYREQRRRHHSDWDNIT